MSPTYLEFEQPIADLEAKIQELRSVGSDNAMDLEDEVARLENKLKQQIEQTFSSLSDWQITQLSRHPMRPYTLDYVGLMCEEFHELHGDRSFGDDDAIVGGLARINGRAVMLIGHQKGRDTREKLKRNFGMPRPEGYRKALRLMHMAARFGLPIITLIDTPGAYPGVGAEERGQSEAIARNLRDMARLPVPIVVNVIGEGGSGGALAIGVGDRVNMMQYSIYSVISPEGCASILWKDTDRAREAAAALGITSKRLAELKLIDSIVDEPAGGAHRDNPRAAGYLRERINEQLNELEQMDVDSLLERRYERLMALGRVQRSSKQ